MVMIWLYGYGYMVMNINTNHNFLYIVYISIKARDLRLCSGIILAAQKSEGPHIMYSTMYKS